jgi:hypothetical protein
MVERARRHAVGGCIACVAGFLLVLILAYWVGPAERLDRSVLDAVSIPADTLVNEVAYVGFLVVNFSTAVGWGEFNDSADRHISERLVELADVQSGRWVLDIAAGYGEPALTAARKAGPEGSVVATDISDEMLAFGRQRAAAAGLGNVEFVESDASSLDFPELRCRCLALGNHLRARRGDGHGAHPRLPQTGRADGDQLVGRARSGPLPLDSDEDDDGAVGRAPAPARNARAPLRPTPAAIGGLLEGGGFSKVAVEQNL